MPAFIDTGWQECDIIDRKQWPRKASPRCTFGIIQRALFFPDQWQHVSAEVNHFFQLWPARQNKLSNSHFLIFDKSASEFLGRANQADRRRTMGAHSSPPEIWRRPFILICHPINRFDGDRIALL